MSVNIVPEHALPKSFFFEEELSSSTGRRMASEPARTLRAELSESSPAFEAVGAEQPRAIRSAPRR